MIVGQGLMAKAFKESEADKKFIIFASGVSNSLEVSSLAFEREKKLLADIICKHRSKKIIYFSTCSINDDEVNERPYVKHKLFIEDYISNESDHFLICRVSNVVGNNGNANTIINFLYNCIQNQIEFEAWRNSERNIIDIDDVVTLVNKLNDLAVNNRIINIANEKNYKVFDIITEIEKYTGKKASYKILEKGKPLNIDVSDLKDRIIQYSAMFNDTDNYISNILHKYFNRA